MATSLKHVKHSMNGGDEDVAVLPQTDSSFSFEPAAPTVIAETKYIVFRLVKKKVKRLTLDGRCLEVVNPKTGRPETIHLIRGAHSIWTSELKETLSDKESVSRNRVGLQFLDGICRIGVHETVKLEYARANRNNVGKNRTGSGKYDYFEYDAMEEQKMRYDKQMSRIHLIQRISEMKEAEVKKLALYVGIKPYDDEVGMPLTPDGFKTQLLIKADTQPDIVSKYIGSKEVEVSYLVRNAIMDAKIDLTGQSGNALWAGGQGFICKIPANRKALEYLTELAMTNSNEGRQFKEQLEQIIT